VAQGVDPEFKPQYWKKKKVRCSRYGMLISHRGEIIAQYLLKSQGKCICGVALMFFYSRKRGLMLSNLTLPLDVCLYFNIRRMSYTIISWQVGILSGQAQGWCYLHLLTNDSLRL
jgi:hypothetical protein